MKRILSILMLATLAFTFVSCGDDDDNPSNKLMETVDSHTYSLKILAGAGSSFEMPMTMKLENFAKVANEVNSVRSAEATADSYIKISGVEKGGYNFEQLTLKVVGTDIKRTFTNVTTDGVYKGIDSDLPFLNKVAKRLADRKEIQVNVIGKTEKEVNKNVEVQISLAILFNKGIK